MSAYPLPAVFNGTGLTYRQLDYWARAGYLHPEQAEAGSGFYRQWPDSEVQVARLMVRLVATGFTPRAAARIARVGLRHHTCLGNGICLQILPDGAL